MNVLSNRITLFVVIFLGVFVVINAHSQDGYVKSISVSDQMDSIILADVSPDSTLIAVTGQEYVYVDNVVESAIGKTVIYNLSTGDRKWEFSTLPGFVFPSTMGFSANGEYLMVSFGFAGLRVFDAETGEQLYDIRSDEPHRYCGSTYAIGLGFTVDGQRFITSVNCSNKDNPYRAWDVSTGDLDEGMTRKLKSMPGSFRGFTTFQDVVIIGKPREQSKLYDLKTEIVIQELPGSNEVIDQSNNLRYLFNVNQENDTIGVYDLETMQTVSTYDRSAIAGGFNNYSVSNQGILAIAGQGFENGSHVARTLVAPNPSRVLHAYPFVREDPEKKFSHDATIHFFPDGKRFLTANNSTINIWDISEFASSVPGSKSMQ